MQWTEHKHRSLVPLNSWLARTAFGLLVGAFALPVSSAQNPPARSPADVFRQARSSVVLIVGSEGRDKVAQGSGFIVGKDKIVTNYHVIAGLSAAVVLFADGHTEPVTGVVAADADQDAAILNVRTGTRPPLPLGDELNLHEGDAVLAIGAPQGLELSLTNGIISAFRNSEKKFLIQNTAPIAPGSSGGPLLDSHGRVVGVTTSLLVDTPGVYFSIGVGTVKRLLKGSPTMTQPFAGATEPDDARPSPNLSSTFEWIKGKIESKAGGTFDYQNYLPDPSEVGLQKIHGLTLQQSSEKCVFLLTFKRDLLTHSVYNSIMKDTQSGCELTSEEDYVETLPVYYLKQAKLITLDRGVPAVDLKFDGKKHKMHWEGNGSRTGCRDASLNRKGTTEAREMLDDFLLIQFYRYPTEDNEDLARRVADAFNHAAALCANQKPVSQEPF